MIKKASIVILAASLFLVSLGPVLVQAQGGLEILSNSAEVEFPSQLNFSLSAESDVDINDIRLHYSVDRESFAEVTSEVYVDFVPGDTVNVQWAWDMRRTGGLPPGSDVEYWWTLEDASGDKIETAPVRVRFDDNRYSWQSLTQGLVTIYWYEGGQSFVEELMSIAQEAMERMAENTGAYLKKPVEIYIYADSQDLLGSMIFSQEWTGGVSYSEYGVIAIGIAPNNLAWGKTAIVHELTHLVVHQVTFNPYNNLPRWLDEGLATYNEGLLDPMSGGLLLKAVTEDTLLTVRTLCSPFSSEPEKAYLSYAQSYSLIEFLVATYGQGKMLGLLNAFAAGSNYDAALEKVYGFDLDGLNTLWRDYVRRKFQGAEVTTPVVPPDRSSEEKEVPPALVGAIAGLGLAILLVLGLVGVRWARRRGR